MCEFIEALVAECPYDGDEGFRVGGQNEYAWVETDIGRVEILASEYGTEHNHVVLWPWGGEGLLTKGSMWILSVDRPSPIIVKAKGVYELYDYILDVANFVESLSAWFNPEKFTDCPVQPMEDKNEKRRWLESRNA